MIQWTGRTLGKVHIESLIARGGVAEVYLGTHTTLQRKVAVKILRGQFEDDRDLLERFQREAVVVSRLRHPNIVQIYDFDSVAGHPYIVMEHISGPSLSRYLDVFHGKGKRLDLPVISRLLISVASALEYAHKMGVIHRDVKPGNILLTAHSAQVVAGITMPPGFVPILTDFGLVRFLNSSRHSTAGQIAGTPAYMSPEQARGEATDERTDIYSLGIVLYEMLSGGRVPFDGETTMSVLLKQIHEPISPIAGLAPALQRVLDRALAKDRVDRYQTPTQFASDFQDALEQQTEPDTFVYETPSPAIQKSTVRPRAKWWPAAAFGLLAILLGYFLRLGGISTQDAGIIPDTGGTIPATTSPVQAALVQPAPAIVLRFRNGSAIADRAELIALTMPLPPAGSNYEAWLIGGEVRESLGVLVLDEQGNGTLTFTESNGVNLIGLYDRAEVTLEKSPDDDPGTPGQIVYAFTVPADRLVHVRHLLSSFPNTPDEAPITLGLITNIRLIQQSAADMKAEYENGNSASMKKNAESILNLIAGEQSPDYKDWDGDGERLDPFDGYGLLLNGSQSGYIQTLYSEADFAANTPSVTLVMINHGEAVKTCAQNLATWAPKLRDNVLTILTSGAGSDLEQSISNSFELANQMLDGGDTDSDQSVELIPGECGATLALENAYSLADMHLVPANLVPTSSASDLNSTASPTVNPAPRVVSPTTTSSEPESTAVPQSTRPGNRRPDRPRPTKRNP